MKKCTKCKLSKSRESFYKDSRAKSGLSSWCKTCTDTNNASRKVERSEYNKRWASENKDKINARRRRHRDTVAGKFVQYRRGAKRRSLDFSLSKEFFESLVTKNCYYCNDKDEGRELVGIDRVDSSKGYTDSNCIPCCEKCNRMKMDSNQEDFFNRIAKIYEAHYGKAKKK